jgi:hypothetical protein
MPDVPHLKHPLLYRALRNKRWIPQKSTAFRLRPTEVGLSVILLASCTKDVCDAQQNSCFGELVLETLAIMTSGRRVEQTARNHGEILGLPPYEADELVKEEAASELADLVISVQLRPTS